MNSFTEADDRLLLQLEAQGVGMSQIARMLTQAFPDRPRSHNTVIMRLSTLARRDERLQRRPMPTPSGPPNGETVLQRIANADILRITAAP